jgi:hypothetical protein
MRNPGFGTVFGLALLGAVTVAATAKAGSPSSQDTMLRQVYWSGDYCGPRCQEHQWRRHERWEAHRHWWHHPRWQERRYGYYAYPRY